MTSTAENIDLVTTTIAENKNDNKTEESEEENENKKHSDAGSGGPATQILSAGAAVLVVISGFI